MNICVYKKDKSHVETVVQLPLNVCVRIIETDMTNVFQYTCFVYRQTQWP